MSEHPLERSHKTIFVINDNRVQLDILSGILTKAGYKVGAYSSAENALREMDPAAPPTLIVTDLYMPGIDGWRFCRLLRSSEYKAYNKIPILVVSATFSGEEAARITANSGANAFMRAPVDGVCYLEAVESLLRGEPARHRLRVLIVEDARTQALKLSQDFTSHGYIADRTGSIKGAAEMFSRHVYDVVVLDYHLPDGKGDVLLIDFLAHRPDCIIIMITTDPRPELALEWIKKGAAAYIRKPFDPDYLLELCAHARREHSLLQVEHLLQKRTQELHEREADLALAQEIGHMGSWSYIPGGNTLMWSDMLYRLLGLEPGTPPDPDLKFGLSRVHPDDREDLSADFAAALSSGQRDFEYIFRTVPINGQERIMQGQARIERDKAGEPVRIIGIDQDVTERRRAEQKLMLMADMLDTAPNSITVHDFSGRFLYANSKTFELHGYAEHEFMSMNLHDLDMPASEERIEERIRIIEQEGEAAFEVAHLTKDGKVIPFEVFAKKVRWAGIPALLSVATDLRERKRTEARLQEAKEKAETANRAKNTFLANMSHEIRTPLNAILGFAELLYQISEQATPEQREYLEIIMQRSEDLLKLLNDILSISAMEANRLSVNPERIDLREFTEDLMFLFHEPLRQKNLKGIVHIAEGTPGVICSDPVRLRQVLVNLLGNAVKFTQHGQIELLIEPAGDAVAPSPPIAFSVKDTGIGIPADQQDFIFGHFTQVDQSHTRQFGGAGLGLTVCKGLVELMGGEIEVQSSTNKGSCFRFTVVPFPETADRPAAVPTSDSTLLIDTLPHLHLLLAEDDPAGRRLTEKLLERQGHTFTSVLTGTEALQEWERSSYDLILMDLEMPDMNGVEATREIRRREHQAGVTSGIPIIAMTAHIFPEHREECAEAGMNDFLGKPVRAKELQRIISQWIPVTGS